MLLENKCDTDIVNCIGESAEWSVSSVSSEWHKGFLGKLGQKACNDDCFFSQFQHKKDCSTSHSLLERPNSIAFNQGSQMKELV